MGDRVTHKQVRAAQEILEEVYGIMLDSQTVRAALEAAEKAKDS